MKNLILFLWFLLLQAPLWAQQIQGVLVDASNNEPLPGANLWFKTTQRGTASNANGGFTINAPAAQGTYTLLVSMLGYRELELEINLTSNDQALDSLRLIAEPTLIQSDLVITAQRSLNQAFATSEAVSVLKATDILHNGARSTPEALMGLTGVFVQKTNHGGGSPFIRGLTGNQTLLLMDGLRLNNSIYRFGPNQYFNTIDVFSVQQIEVVRGAGSVLYGSDAMGGAIQVFTSTPQFSAEGWQFGGRLLGRYLDRDMEKTVHAELNAANENIAFRAGVSVRNFGDLYAGKGKGQEGPSNYRERAADAKAIFKLSRHAQFTMAYNGLFQSDVNRYDQYVTGFALSKFEPQTRQMAYARLAWEGQSPWLQKITLTGSWQFAEEGRIFQRVNNVTRSKEKDEIRTLGYVLEWHAQPFSFWKITSGLEAYFDKVTSGGTNLNTETGVETVRRGLYPAGTNASNLAAFTAHNLNWKQWSLNLGLRYNKVRLEIQDAKFGNTEITPDALVAHAMLRYQLGTQHAISAGTYSGFRAPNINDMTSFGRFDFGIEVPSYNLSPERSTTYELTYKYSSAKLQANISGFYTALSDLVTRVRSTFEGQPKYEGSDVYKKENAATSFIRGTELDFAWSISQKFNLQGSLTYAFGQNTTAHEPMRRIPPLNGRIGLQYQPVKNWFNRIDFLYASKQDRLASGDKSDPRIPKGGTPGWEVLNLRSAYQFKQVELQAGLNNLFNEAYRTHGSGIDGVGRSVWIGLDWKF